MSFPRPPRTAAERNAVKREKYGIDQCFTPLEPLADVSLPCSRKYGHKGVHIAAAAPDGEIVAKWLIKVKVLDD